ncbi:hypothetical protein ORI20_06270 [Mycobacterium sp. CVI_P3]|uniref:DUF1761 domain-containing protein n=1 Tax=Mycobacterium pinniadriaticum TaxID=2994102 RepID=A0ABT3SAG9_9MYCO|nr:hypothetical protein [Mycobacterium pinniadriaticum]MCX2929868.1 hypothetical protein [Mycobacterium pinniadriaticum]MCX2936483.1 hypothetical protein [Mycobacterium pinniadriaticum]
MSAIEIVALVGAVIVPIKILWILWRGQKSWYETITKKYWRNPVVTTMLSLLASAALLVILLQELTIVEIWASTLFAMALVSLALAPFSKHMLKVEHAWFSETDVVRTGWVPALVWTGLIVWVLYALFT